MFAPRVCSTKTRIKTHGQLWKGKWCHLREYVPLKQGLRLIGCELVEEVGRTPRVCSTKTRIKTQNEKEIAWETWASESMFH